MAEPGSDDPTRWFDELSVAAEAGEAVVPWDRGSPRFCSCTGRRSSGWRDVDAGRSS
jgi:hypothetical protein